MVGITACFCGQLPYAGKASMVW